MVCRHAAPCMRPCISDLCANGCIRALAMHPYLHATQGWRPAPWLPRTRPPGRLANPGCTQCPISPAKGSDQIRSSLFFKRRFGCAWKSGRISTTLDVRSVFRDQDGHLSLLLDIAAISVESVVRLAANVLKPALRVPVLLIHIQATVNSIAAVPFSAGRPDRQSVLTHLSDQ